MKIPKVAIVGGGPGGLFTAYLLQKLPHRPLAITIFEATDRLGGKILTRRFQTANIRYEAGAAEFYDYSSVGEDPLKELILELGLPIRAMGGAAVVLDGQLVANQEDFHRVLGEGAHRSLLAFDRRAKDRITPQEFYHAE